MFVAKHNNNSTGKIGENHACEFIIKSGGTILFRNYRRKSDEIDIIALSSDKTLVFCEVKALFIKDLSPLDALRPEDNMTVAKLRKISRTCEFFTRKYPHLIDPEKGWRIDLFAIDLYGDGKAKDIRHYKNI